MTDEEVKALPLVNLTFKYVAINVKGKPFFVWVDDQGRERNYLASGAKNPVDASPGMIYSFPQTESAGIISSHGKYLRRYEGQEVKEWSAIHRANREILAATRALSKEVNTDPLIKCIEPIGKAYAAMNSAQRAHLIAWVVRQIVQYAG
jgi:hypothetical protein